MYNYVFFILALSASFSASVADLKIFPNEIDGVEVQPHSIPFIVSLVSKSATEGNVTFCSGSLLNEHWILTASHCVDRYPLIHVIAGHHSIDAKERSTQVRQVFASYQYLNEAGETGGIALLYVRNGFNYTKEVQPVKFGDLESIVGGSVSLQGWGCSLTSKIRIYPENLRSVNLTLLSAEKCKAACSMFDEKTHFCAEDSNRMVCVEQTGGPVLKDGLLVGVVPPKMESCGSVREFIKVSPYKAWIEDQVSMDFDVTFYGRNQATTLNGVDNGDLIEINGNQEDSLIQAKMN